jgi:hypothetical protein
MTRLQLLRLLVAHARSHGFSLRKWYTGALGLPWEGAPQAMEVLAAERRYYALLFSHDFASCFWKAGEPITISVPRQSFTRVRPDGSIMTVSRKSYVRRAARTDEWRYHLREMASAEEPLRYIRRFLRIEEQQDDVV